MTSWVFAYDGFDPERERQREALFTLGNGYMGTRGALPHTQAGDLHYPGTYLAGVYNRSWSTIEGQDVEIESLVNAPNWLPLTWRIEGGAWLDFNAVTILDYRQELDLKRGVLSRTYRVEDAQGRRTRVTERRFVHMQQCHLAGLDLSLLAENWSGCLEVWTAIEGRVTNSLVTDERGMNGQHLEPVATGKHDADGLWLTARTLQSRIEISVAARTRITVGESAEPATRGLEETSGAIAQTMTLDVSEGDEVVVEKVAALFSSRDVAISESRIAACDTIANAPDLDELLRTHTEAWVTLWQRCDIDLENGDEEVQLIVRLHLFHILQTTSRHTRSVDTGALARGLTGEGYHGHIFWDELFILPYLNFHFPDVSRWLLRYRHVRLAEARRRAQDAGYAGAMYPWQSGSMGREETPPFYPNPRTGGWIRDFTSIQRHVSLAIAYNVWHYYEVTGDREFLAMDGIEMLAEIARFWASIATYNPDHERYEIHGVMGPDEFHTGYPWTDEPGLSNNTYTNVMVVWVLRAALTALDTVPRWRRDEICELLDLSEEEIARWDTVARRMRVVFLESGELAQFEHYDRLEELDWEAYRERYGDLQRLDHILDAEGDTPNRYRLSKQPDVLMLFYLFSQEELKDIFASMGYAFDRTLRQRTTDFYLQRMSVGSTLSRVVNADVLISSDPARSWAYFETALQSDVGDIQGGSTGEGLHLGAMAGTIEIIERRYTGVDARGDELHFTPALPRELSCLRTVLFYRGLRLAVTITHERIQVSTASEGPVPVTITVGDRSQAITPDSPIDWPLPETRPALPPDGQE